MSNRSHQADQIPRGKIIGRIREQEILKNQFESKKAEFMAVYGRRRVGKTYLIKNFMETLPCVFFHVTGQQNGSVKEQLTEFSKQLAITFYQGAPLIPRTSWPDAFEDLTNAMNKLPKLKKVVLFFDEFPWIATPRSKLIQALELYWNRYWVFDPRIKLIICGSATSWIIKHVLNNKGGLHNRVTRAIQLKPFTLKEAENYLRDHKISLNQRQILDLYTVFGGVPLYWSFVQKGQTAHQCIDEVCFKPDGSLVKEFNRLFESLFVDAKPYIELIRLIAKQRYGIGQAELIVKSKLPDGGGTIARLRELEEAGFILSLVPYGRKDKGVYYLVDDEYCLFYLYWIEPYLKTITKKAMKEQFWVYQSTQQSWKIWAGLAFESICYKHIDQIAKALKIPPGSSIGTWRYVPKNNNKEEKGAQIDLLFDRLDNAMTLCEIKRTEEKFSIDKSYVQELQSKMEVFRKHTKTKKQLFLAMVTTMGLKNSVYSEEYVSGQVTLEHLFQE